MKQKLLLVFSIFLLLVPFAYAQMGGGGGGCEPTNVPANTNIIHATTRQPLEACAALQSAIIQVGEDDIAVFTMSFNSDVDFTGSVFRNNKAQEKVLAVFGSETGVTSFTLQLPYDTSKKQTIIGICEGATALAHIDHDTCISDTSKKWYTLEIGSADAPLAVAGDDDRVVQLSVSGTGAVLVDSGFVGGGSSGSPEDVDAYLEVPVTYDSREKLTHDIHYKEISFPLTVIEIDLKSTFAVLSFIDQGITFPLDDGAKKYVDLTKDGRPDVAVELLALRYPELTLSITECSEPRESTLPPTTEEGDGFVYSTPGEDSVFSKFFTNKASLGVRVIAWSVVAILALFFVMFVVRQYLGTIIKGL